jgi:hypothetical protein
MEHVVSPSSPRLSTPTAVSSNPWHRKLENAPEVVYGNGIEVDRRRAALPEVYRVYDSKFEQASPTAEPAQKPEPRRVKDMKATTFWLIIAIIALVVIGVTLGGALGGTLALKNSPSSTTYASII